MSAGDIVTRRAYADAHAPRRYTGADDEGGRVIRTVRIGVYAAERPRDVVPRPSARRESTIGRFLALAAAAAGLVGWLVGRSIAVAIGGGEASAAPPGLTIPIAAVAALLSATSVYLVDSLVRRPSPGSVRIDPLAPAARFMPTRWAQAAPLVVAGVLVAPILAYGIAQLPPDPFVWGTALAGVPLAGAIAVTWRNVPGLEVSDAGIRGLRFARRVELSWQELKTVSVTEGRRPRLVLESVSGRRVDVHAMWLGSDPAEVAYIIDFFRTRPQDRELLTVPVTAIEWVAESAYG